MDIKQEALKFHRDLKGKIEVISRAPVKDAAALTLAYTPGVAQPCLEIQKDTALSYTYTRRANLVLVVTDGTAVLGLGDIGPEAAMPVMEGKCVLFKEFADVDAFPLCIRSKDVDEIVRTISLISGSFGGINLEDISAPRCFEIEKRLKEVCDIPIFHDDQHGTAVVAAAALINALRVVGKSMEAIKVCVSGAGASAISVSRLIMSMGVNNLTLCDRNGAIYKGRADLNNAKAEMAEITNPEGITGSLSDAIRGADVFIGLSSPGLVTAEMVASMAKDAIVFAMANPTPEIFPDEAKRGGARVIGTGRSDFPNQINNVLAFPGIFRGALDIRAREITEEMKIAAARAIASVVPEEKLCAEFIVPDAFDPTVAPTVAASLTTSVTLDPIRDLACDGI